MMNRVRNYLQDMRARQRISIALSKGCAAMQARRVDLTQPATWEFSGFSQNGEDGILEVLRCQLTSSNRYFIEIGASDGIQNNSAWLVIVEKYNGLMIEGSPQLVDRAKRTIIEYSIGVDVRTLFVTRESALGLKSLAVHTDPDALSLDIDGNDYYIAEALLGNGFRPRIFVVEYNSAYGPERSLTIEYRSDFVVAGDSPASLYYGASISGWTKLMREHGYRFVTVDRNGVNAFFVDPNYFDPDFLAGVRGLAFAENQAQLMRLRRSSEAQFALIANQKFVPI